MKEKMKNAILYAFLLVGVLLLLFAIFVGVANGEERVCYIVNESGEINHWCEPDFAMYNSNGYQMFTLEWLAGSCGHNGGCVENKERWMTWILAARK